MGLSGIRAHLMMLNEDPIIISRSHSSSRESPSKKVKLEKEDSLTGTLTPTKR